MPLIKSNWITQFQKKRKLKKEFFFPLQNEKNWFCGKSLMQVNWKLINSKVTRWVSVDKLWKSRNSSHLFAKLIWYFNGDLSFCLVPKLVFSYNSAAVMNKLQSHRIGKYIEIPEKPKKNHKLLYYMC